MDRGRNTSSPEAQPPPSAVPASGQVYRCCQADPPSEADLRTSEERGLSPDLDPRLRRGIAVFGSPEGALHQSRLFRWRHKAVAGARLREEYGCIQQSGAQPLHHTWWPISGMDAALRSCLFVTERRQP